MATRDGPALASMDIALNGFFSDKVSASSRKIDFNFDEATEVKLSLDKDQSIVSTFTRS